jgi:glycosyltransferase involved in cell wall biosynthesis
MRILFMSQLLPLPLDAGPKIRSYYVLRYLAEAGHEVTLLCFIRPGDSSQDISQLRKICGSVEAISLVRSQVRDIAHGLRSLFSSTPFLIQRDQLASMQQKVEQITGDRSFDALHADQLWMAPYVMRCPNPTLKVLDQHNAVFMVARRMAEHHHNPVTKALLNREASKLENFEHFTCEHFDRVVWVTEEDRRRIGSNDNGHRSRNTVIPIATDPSTQMPVKRPQPFRVTFLGGMHWPPNSEGILWFADTVWPRVTRVVPSAVLTLIGKGAPRRLLRQYCATRLDVPGYVPDLKQYLSETAVFVVPIRSGAGMRVKILDAWCWGLPVVSTSLGAEGIQATDGENLLIADDAESFADRVTRVLQDGSVARRLSENGRSAVEMFYDWRKVYKAWDQIYH